MRANPVVERATEEHAIAMAPRLRLIDCREVRAHLDPLDVTLGAVRQSSHAWTWLVEGRPVCMFGVVPRDILGGVGMAWLLSTDDIALDRRTFLLGSKVALAELLKIYPTLEGYVDARFTQSVRWLTRLGFVLHDARDYAGVPLRYFKVRR